MADSLFDPVPRGWTVWNRELILDRSVAGYVARGQQVQGFCRHQNCRRSCWIDCDRLVERGLGGLRIDEAKAMWRCNRVSGCQITFVEDNHGLLTLQSLVSRRRAQLRLNCKHCKVQWQGGASALIERLVQNGEGDGDLLLGDIEKRLTRPCKACGQAGWSVRVMWRD